MKNFINGIGKYVVAGALGIVIFIFSVAPAQAAIDSQLSGIYSSAVFIVLGIFILVVLISLMLFIVLKLLRLLFPARFSSMRVPDPKKKQTAKKGGQLEDRCASCGNFGVCPVAFSGKVSYPCTKFVIQAAVRDPAAGADVV